MGSAQWLDTLEYGGRLLRRQRRGEAHRHEAVHDHLLRRARVLVVEAGFGQRVKPWVRERPAPFAAVETQRGALVGRDEGGEFATQSTDSSRTFHTSPSRPPGLSTR